MNRLNPSGNLEDPSNGKPIIVTGASGYLGSTLVTYFNSLGVKVLPFSRRSTQKYLPYDRIDEYMNGSYGIIHCAAITEWFGNPQEIMKINGIWPVDLFKRANELKVEKFVFMSSIAVYGYWNRRPVTITEESRKIEKPFHMSDYGLAKDYAERELIKNRDYTKLNIFQLGVIYDEDKMSRRVLNNEVGIYHAQQRLPYVHIQNVCNAVTEALKSENEEATYLLIDDEQPNILQYNSLMGFYSHQYPQWKYFLSSLVRLTCGLIHGRRNSVRCLLHEEDCLRRSNVYSNYKIKTYLPYTQTVRLSDCLKKDIQSIQTIPSRNLYATMRLAVIGYGGWGKHIADVVSSDKKFEIVAVCDSESVNTRLSPRHEAAHLFHDIDMMLRCTHLDGAIVCTPNFCHAGNILQLAPHVKHIYLEKPLANNRIEREMIEQCIAEQRVALFVGHTLSQSQGIQFMKQKVKECGRIINVRLIRTLAKDYPDNDWRTKPSLCPGGVIAQLGVHLFDIALEILNELDIQELTTEKSLRSGQIWACKWKANSMGAKITIRAAFSEKNAFDIFVQGEKGEVQLDDDHIRWAIQDIGDGDIPANLDSGTHVILNEFYQSWFMMYEGIGERAVTVAALYEKSLELL